MKRIIHYLNKLEEGTLAVTLLALAFLSFFEVVGRYVFNHSFSWFEEMARYASVFITFLGAGLGVKYGTHFSMDYLVTRVGSRTGNLMRLASSLVAGSLFGLLSWYGFGHSAKMYRFGTTSAAMGLPMWLAYLPIAVFSLVIALRFCLIAHAHLRRFINNEPLSGLREETGEAGS